MSETDYSRASVLLFDPVHANLRTTRYTLHEIGFKRITYVSSAGEFDKLLTDTAPDLIVADSSAPDQDIFGRVRALRRSELGSNPFSVILLTTWIRDGQHIRRAIECGADDVIVRPFSTMFAQERIRSLVRVRKDFIVTSDYVGPDRRQDAQRNSDAPPLSVPNLLQARVEGDEKALARASGWLDNARQAVELERLRRVAMRVVISIELQLSDKGEEPAPPLDLKDLAKTAKDMRALAGRAKRREGMEVADALIDHIGSMSDPNSLSDRNLRLTKELALGVFAAYANGDSIERSKDEISRTVSNLRKRLQSRSDEASGQGGRSGLKRAAM